MSAVTPTVKLQYVANTYSMHEYFLILNEIYGRTKLLPFTLHSGHRQNTFGNDHLTCMEHMNNKDEKGKSEWGQRDVEWNKQAGSKHGPFFSCAYHLPVTQLGPLAGRDLASVQKVQWNNINFGFAFIEKIREHYNIKGGIFDLVCVSIKGAG